jgi:hypothetical protein
MKFRLIHDDANLKSILLELSGKSHLINEIKEFWKNLFGAKREK